MILEKNKYENPELTIILCKMDAIRCSGEIGDEDNSGNDGSSGEKWSPVVPFD